jgi:aminoglycoside phosphotransferase (APT) family kinase protein
MSDPVDRILAAHGIRGPWARLPTTGLANRVYATRDVVLRIATDHPDAIPDARTESIAAPVAHIAGVRTPRLIAFDDSRAIIDRPLSLWERIRGETLGLAKLDRRQHECVWHEVGRELDLLHSNVHACADPRGYLDTPGYEPNLAPTVARLVDAGRVSAKDAADIEHVLLELAPFVFDADQSRCFVHNDLHEMNVMCTSAGGLLAIIDWGDAGWGDPALDFAAIPLDAIPAALEGYGPDGRARLGLAYKARIVWTKLHDAMDDALEQPGRSIPLRRLRDFLAS